jgi:transposase-like protein
MIKDVPIPRFRTNTPGWEPSSLQVFPQQQDQFMHLISEMHRVGVTQRKVAKIARECFGVKLSANRVGFIHRELAQREEAQINTRKLEDIYQYLYLDGLWVKAKGYGWESNKAVLLCVLALLHWGNEKLLGLVLLTPRTT